MRALIEHPINNQNIVVTLCSFVFRPLCILISGAMLVFSTGCLTIPQAPGGKQQLSEVLPDPDQVRQQWASRSKAGSVDSAWIKSFNDRALESYVGDVLAGNIELGAARQAVAAAAASARKAGALLRPQLNAAGTASQLDRSGADSTDSSELSAQVSWELDLWGRVRAARAAAGANYRATEAEYQDARLSLAALAAKAWYLATETYLQLEFAKEIVGIQQKRLDLVTIKFEEGELSPKEKHLAGADLNSAKDRLQQVTLAHRNALRTLEVLAGKYPAAAGKFSRKYVPVPPPVPAGVPSELVERRPDLRAASEQVAAAFNLVTEAKAARLPRIGLTAAAGRSSNDLVDLLDQGPGFWAAGANFVAPIYQGGALKEQVVIRTAEQKAALSLFGQKALNAFNEVETALDGESILRNRERFLKGALDENQEALDIAQKQFDAGKLDLLSVLQMQERVIASKIAWINIRNTRLAQRITLHLALGGSFE
ncbi:MAG: efflux transporter outer membrane subunit [Akkermansiaceae bacterium]